MSETTTALTCFPLMSLIFCNELTKKLTNTTDYYRITPNPCLNLYVVASLMLILSWSVRSSTLSFVFSPPILACLLLYQMFICLRRVVGEKGVKTRGKENSGQSQGPVLFSLFSLRSPCRRFSFTLARPVLKRLALALFRWCLQCGLSHCRPLCPRFICLPSRGLLLEDFIWMLLLDFPLKCPVLQMS